MSVATSTAILIAAGVGAAGSVAAGAISAHAAGSAADKEAVAGQAAADRSQTAGDTANAKIGDVLKQQQDLLSPYAKFTPSQPFSYNPADVEKDPAYQFQLSEGLKAVQRAAAAGGTLNSGGTLKALTKYASGVTAGYENQDYGQALSTFGTNAQLGEYGTSGLLQALQGYGNLFSSNTIGTANTVSNDLLGKANAQAAGTVGQANAYSGALGGVANSATLATLLASLTGGSINNPQNIQNSTNAGASSINSVGLPTGGIGAPASVPAPSAFTPNNLSGYAGTGYGSPPVTPITWDLNRLGQ